jgi:cytochrome c oxidase subunit 4
MQEPSRYPADYFKTYVVLLALLALTFTIAQFNFGRWNMVASLTIAVLKALCVILVFMRVRESSKEVWVYVGAGFFWLFLLLALSMGDYLTR